METNNSSSSYKTSQKKPFTGKLILSGSYGEKALLGAKIISEKDWQTMKENSCPFDIETTTGPYSNMIWLPIVHLQKPPQTDKRLFTGNVIFNPPLSEQLLTRILGESFVETLKQISPMLDVHMAEQNVEVHAASTTHISDTIIQKMQENFAKILGKPFSKSEIDENNIYRFFFAEPTKR